MDFAYTISQYDSPGSTDCQKNNSWFADNGHNLLWNGSYSWSFRGPTGDSKNLYFKTNQVIGISIKIDGKREKLTEIKLIFYNKENMKILKEFFMSKMEKCNWKSAHFGVLLQDRSAKISFVQRET